MSKYFEVDYLGQDVELNIPIMSGVSFGYVDKELVFEVRIQESQEPLRVEFYVKTDSSKKTPEFEFGKIKNNTLSLYFYNPSESGTSGLNSPISLLSIDSNILGFMFHIDSIPNAIAYRITYEFYHGSRPKVGGDI
jgi:hypothetical protein